MDEGIKTILTVIPPSAHYSVTVMHCSFYAALSNPCAIVIDDHHSSWHNRERGGAVVECKPHDQKVMGSIPGRVVTT
jgi:hypothetical protein